MELLIAGVNGYIGSNLYSHFIERYSVSSIDFGNESIKKNYTNIDLSEIDNVKHYAKECTQFDVLVFLVGLAHSKGKGKDLPEFKKANYHTLVYLLSSLKENQKIPRKIIFASTISVYGERYEREVYDETISPKPFSPYAVTKLLAEEYLRNNHEANAWILRFAPVYSKTFQLNIIRRTRIKNIFYKVGKGEKKLSLCNMENIMDSIVGIIEGVIPPGVYNISDPAAYTYNDLLNEQKAKNLVRIPIILIRLLHKIGKLINNTFLIENSTKLLTNNIYPPSKIQSYVNLTAMRIKGK